MSQQLETVARFNDLTQARSAHTALEAAGISSTLQDQNMGSIDWGLMPAMGGLRLQVKSEDAASALEIVDGLGVEVTDDESELNEPDNPEERAYRDSSRRRKRLVVLVSFLILLLPTLIAMIVSWLP
jgi:hypothetical protein